MQTQAVLVKQLSEQLRRKQWRVSTAESCTGGLIAAAITELAGSSDVFECGFVTYSNKAKQKQLGVPASLLIEHGAVSEPVALAMAKGAAVSAAADVSVAVTGIAGPGGGSEAKPVGTVWIAWYCQGRISAQRFIFSGERHQVRQATVVQALRGLLAQIDETED